MRSGGQGGSRSGNLGISGPLEPLLEGGGSWRKVDLWSPCWEEGGHRGRYADPVFFFTQLQFCSQQVAQTVSYQTRMALLLREIFLQDGCEWFFKMAAYSAKLWGQSTMFSSRNISSRWLRMVLQDGCILSQAIGANPRCSHHSQFG